jgi:hypothetical protein
LIRLEKFTVAPCRFVVWAWAFSAIVVMAEATAVYTAKPAATANLATDVYLGSCRVDSSLISCAREFYPFALPLTFLGICVTAAIALVLWNRQRP